MGYSQADRIRWLASTSQWVNLRPFVGYKAAWPCCDKLLHMTAMAFCNLDDWPLGPSMRWVSKTICFPKSSFSPMEVSVTYCRALACWITSFLIGITCSWAPSTICLCNSKRVIPHVDSIWSDLFCPRKYTYDGELVARLFLSVWHGCLFCKRCKY